MYVRDHPSIHIPKLLKVKYFLKTHSLTLLSHLTRLVIKVEVFFNHERIVYTNFIDYKSLYYKDMILNTHTKCRMSVLWGWFKNKQVCPSFREQN